MVTVWGQTGPFKDKTSRDPDRYVIAERLPVIRVSRIGARQKGAECNRGNVTESRLDWVWAQLNMPQWQPSSMVGLYAFSTPLPLQSTPLTCMTAII